MFNVFFLFQGFSCYLEEKFGIEESHTRGVVVGYDARHNSLRSVVHVLSLCSLLSSLASCLIQLFMYSVHQLRYLLLICMYFEMLRFAQLTATVLANKNFKVYLFSTVTPTPFTVRTQSFTIE